MLTASPVGGRRVERVTSESQGEKTPRPDPGEPDRDVVRAVSDPFGQYVPVARTKNPPVSRSSRSSSLSLKPAKFQPMPNRMKGIGR